jgi:hypothetical protein
LLESSAAWGLVGKGSPEPSAENAASKMICPVISLIAFNMNGSICSITMACDARIVLWTLEAQSFICRRSGFSAQGAGIRTSKQSPLMRVVATETGNATLFIHGKDLGF